MAETWSPLWTASSTSGDTPDGRRHRVRGCAQRHSGGCVPVFHVFHTPQYPWSSLHFMNRARAPSLGSAVAVSAFERRGGMERDAILAQVLKRRHCRGDERMDTSAGQTVNETHTELPQIH